jgi:hypothetical protein
MAWNDTDECPHTNRIQTLVSRAGKIATKKARNA